MNLLSVLQTVDKPKITVKFFDAEQELIDTLNTILGDGEHQSGDKHNWIIWVHNNIEVIAWTK